MVAYLSVRAGAAIWDRGVSLAIHRFGVGELVACDLYGNGNDDT